MRHACSFLMALLLACAADAFARPPNDDFANRQTLTGLDVRCFGTLEGATIEPGEPPRGSFAPTASVWYAWSAPLDGVVEIGFGLVEFYAVFGVYRGTNLADLVAVTNGLPVGTVKFRARAGETFFIAVDSGYGATGVFFLHLALTPTPPNDSFAKATRVTGSSLWLQSSNGAATVEPGEPHHRGATGPFGKSIWWTWRAPDYGTLRFDLSRLATNTALAVYTGSTVSNLTLMTSNSTSFGTNLSLRVNSGTDYFVAADNTNNVLVDFRLSFSPSPVNDFFTNRLILTGNTGSVTGTTLDATLEPGDPLPASTATVWWEWTAPSASPAVFQFSDQTHFLEAYTNGPLGLQLLFGFDFLFQGFGRYAMPNVHAGTTYLLRVQADPTPGPFSFIWYQSSALALNNHLANRAILTGTNITVNGSLAGATREPNEPNHGSISGNASVWYGWRAPANGALRLSLSNSSSFNVVMACYRGTNYAALTSLANNITPTQTQPATVNVLAGVDYSIAVDSPFSSDTFTFFLVFEPAPPNDNFTNRIFLSGSNITVFGSTRGASKETGEPNHAGSSSRTASAWWTWQSTVNGPVTVTAEGPFDPVLGIYIGTSVNALTTIASNNDYLPGRGDSRATFEAEDGMSYQIAVATALVNAGDVMLQIRQGAPPTVTWTQPTNDLILPLGASVDLAVDATDADGSIAQVRFQDGTNILATLATSPYTFSATNLAYGTYQYRAFAVDNDGFVGVSTQRQVRVPPPNDFFTNRFVIPQNTVSVTGTMAGTARDANEPRQLGGAPRVAWWSWTAPTNGQVYLSITNSSGGSYAVSVYAGAALDTLTYVTWSPTRATWTAQAGVEFQIAAESFNGSEVVLSFAPPPFPSNDHFTNATVIPGTNAVLNASTVEASKETGEPNHAGWAAGRSLWWTWTAPTNGVVVLKTAGSSFDTTLGVYAGNSISSLAVIASNQTSRFSGNSAVTFTATNGVIYRIAVDGYFGAFGDVVLSLSFFSTPANDNFAQRLPLTGQTNLTSGNNRAATREIGESSPSPFGWDKSLWWTWTAPITGRVLMSTEGSTVKNVIAAYSGTSLPSLSQIRNAASITTSNSSIQFDAVAGSAYQIRLDSQSASGGDLMLRLIQPNRAGNDNFAQRFPLSGYVTNVAGHNFNATAEAFEPITTPFIYTVWWSWTAPETRSVSIVPAGATVPSIAVYLGANLFGAVLVASNFPSGSPIGAATFNAVAGVEYEFLLFLPALIMGDFAFSVVPNEAPALQLITPSNGAVFHPGDNVVFNANASDTDGSVSNVLFFAGSFTRIDTTSPYTATASNLPLGDYTATARATDNLSAFATTPPVNFRVAPFNDDFADAAVLSGEFAQVVAQNIGASMQSGEPSHAGQPGGRSIWYSWTTPVDGRFGISTEGSSFNTLLAVYTGTAISNLIAIAQNDNRSLFETWSEFQFNATAGTTYLVAIDGRDGATGTALLTLRHIAGNDQFNSAQVLGGYATTHAHNTGAGLEADEPMHGGFPTGGSLWWTWIAPAAGHYLAVTAGSDFDTVLAVYSGGVLSNLSVVALDDDSAGSGTSLVRFDAVAGEAYRIAVAGYGDARGEVQLTLATNGAPTLFGPASLSQTGFVFRALTEPGTTNSAHRSSNLSNWTPFDSRIAAGWWTDFRDPSPATNVTRFYRVTQP